MDVGTGDGHYVYQRARREPDTLVIGIDASADALARLSERVHRRRARGGAPNALFLRAAAASLPETLSGLALEVHVQFPWGSLLQAVAGGDAPVLARIAALCAPGGRLIVTIGLDAVRDGREWQRLGLLPPEAEHLQAALPARYREAGFASIDTGILSPEACLTLESTWAKRLRRGEGRTVLRLVAEAGSAASDLQVDQLDPVHG
ncbi:MAG: class I SAM-dependent methyltransferase, partial [Pseudomonadales bacterium]